jgi:cytochrome c oxidase subunit 2
VRVELRSKDVMHAFYVPEFRIKQDAIPGIDRVTVARFIPSEKGNFHVVCTELCGAGHSVMFAPIRVVDPAEYDKFVATLRDNARKAALDPRQPARGKQLMQQKYPCGSCHTLADAGLTGTIGPNLAGVETRATNNVDNRLTVSNAKDAAEYMRTSILKPSAFLVAGFNDLMPKTYSDPTVMPDDDREAIVNYLLTQK